MASKELTSLTGLRGVSAIGVTLYHFYWTVPRDREWFHIDVIGRLYLCVDIFFVLSGFVISLNYGHLFRRGSIIRSFREFALRRVARIYPLYAAVFLLYVAYLLYGMAFAGVDYSHDGWVQLVFAHPIVDFLANLFLVQSWGIGVSAVEPAWSVSTEMAVYLVFPFLAQLVLLRSRTIALVSIVGAILVLMTVAWVRLNRAAGGALDAWDGRESLPLLRCLAGFVIGMGTYRLSRWPRITLLFTDAAGVLLIVMLLVALCVGVPDLLLYPLFPLIILCLSGNGGLVSRLFSNRLTYVLGVLSYAIYLIHSELVGLLGETESLLAQHMALPLARVGAACAIYSLLLVASAASYILVERPGRKLICALDVAASYKFGVEERKVKAAD